MPQFHKEKANAAVIIPKDDGNYFIKTDNTRWETIDFINLEKDPVNILEPIALNKVTLQMDSSIVNGLIANFTFDGPEMIAVINGELKQ